MAIPQLSPEERQAALEKAKAARIKRAQVRDDLKSGKLSLKDVLGMKDDPIVGRMKVSTLIETLPGYGKAKAEKVMKDLQIAESRRLRGLGDRQQAADALGISKTTLWRQMKKMNIPFTKKQKRIKQNPPGI